MPPPSRRVVLLGGVAAALVRPRRAPALAALPALPAQEVAPGLVIVPRSSWGPDLGTAGPVPDEPDVRFLLVHHSVDRNDYAADAVPGLLAAIHRFHTTERGWPDIAYNFFVDRFGTVYEGRLGSLAGPKAADATGGSQGFAQLACFVGDHRTSPPTPEALTSMARLLGWLASRHGISLAPGATATFVSRGSNRHPAGTTVTTPTVAGHRDMSATACPGDAAYALVADGTLAARASSSSSVAQPATSAPPASTAPSSTAAPSPTTGPVEPPATTPPVTVEVAAAPAEPASDDRRPELAVGAAVALALAALVLRRRRV